MTQWDAIIIGGGPAGSATAISACYHNRRVLVLEADTFPRSHVGESLIYLWRVFRALGLEDIMDKRFIHKRGSSRIWGHDWVMRSSDFTKLSMDEWRNYSIQVERAEFDDILLKRARSVGADVREGHRVSNIIWNNDRAVGVRHIDPKGKHHAVYADLIVDASGRHCLITKNRKLLQRDPFYPDLSVYAYYTNAQLFDGEYQGNLCLEAVPWGWFWFIPLHTGEVSVGLVSDISSRRTLKAIGLETFLSQAIAQSKMISRLLESAKMVKGPFATASFAYTSKRYAGPGWVVCGDAAAFFDPMWATGVGNALQDGILAGAVIDAVSRNDICTEQIQQYYQQELEERAATVNRLVKFVYRSNHLYHEEPFWQNRRRLSDDSLIDDTLLAQLIRDPSADYYRTAFNGMGIDSAIIKSIDQGIAQIQYQRENADRLRQAPDHWIPKFSETTKLSDGLGINTAGQLKQGLQINNAGFKEFTHDHNVIRLLKKIDGKQTAKTLVDSVLGNSTASGSGNTEHLLSALAYAHRQAMITI